MVKGFSKMYIFLFFDIFCKHFYYIHIWILQQKKMNFFFVADYKEEQSLELFNYI